MATKSASADSDMQLLLEIGESLLADRDPDGALQVFNDALALEPRNADALVGKGRALMTLDNDEQAVRFLELATTIQPDLAAAWVLLGAAALAAGNGELAARAFSRLQRLGVNPAENYVNLARATYFELDLEKARDYAQLALTESPGNEDARAWSDALGRIPDHAAFLVDVGRAHCRRGRFEKGLELFLQALSEAETLDAHLYAGRALLALQRPADAKEHLERALALKPDDAGVLNDLAAAQSLAGEDAAALETLNRLLTIEPENADGLTGKARLLLRAGDDAAATPVIRKLTVTATERPDTWLLEAWRLKAAGRGKRARLAAEHAVALDTLNAPSWLEAGSIFGELSDTALAGLCRSKALHLIGADDATPRAHVAETLRDVESESRELDELELQPDELARAWGDRAIFYAALGELSRALKYSDRLAAELPQHETSETALQRGILLLQLNDDAGARAAFERALQLDPDNSAAHAALDRLGAV